MLTKHSLSFLCWPKMQKLPVGAALKNNYSEIYNENIHARGVGRTPAHIENEEFYNRPLISVAKLYFRDVYGDSA